MRHLPDKPHCPEGKIEEDHFGIAVAFNVSISQVELTVKTIDILFVDKWMKFSGEIVFRLV